MNGWQYSGSWIWQTGQPVTVQSGVDSNGNGDAAGMSKITGDIAKMAAQVPASFETLSGMDVRELLGKVRQIGDKAEKPSNGGKD